MVKKIRRIDNQEDYEKSEMKRIVDDVEETKKEALESIPQIPKEQIPSNNETTKRLLYGNNNNKNAKENTEGKIISSKISRFAKGFKIPDDKKKTNKKLKTK